MTHVIATWQHIQNMLSRIIFNLPNLIIHQSSGGSNSCKIYHSRYFNKIKYFLFITLADFKAIEQTGVVSQQKVNSELWVEKHLIQSPDPSGMYVLFTTYLTYIEINLFPWCIPQSILVVKTLLIHSLLFPPKTIISLPTIKHTKLIQTPRFPRALMLHYFFRNLCK